MRCGGTLNRIIVCLELVLFIDLKDSLFRCCTEFDYNMRLLNISIEIDV